MITREQLADLDEGLLLADGYDDCILGVVYDFGRLPRVAYDRGKMIEKLTADMSWEEAEEYFEFNIAGAYVGERTPVFVDTDPTGGL